MLKLRLSPPVERPWARAGRRPGFTGSVVPFRL